MSPSTKKPRRPRVHVQHPETSAITEGYDPELSVMAARPPIYPVSTYCFHSAAEAKHYFDVALGRADRPTAADGGLIYARLNNPNAEMFEDSMVPLEKSAVGAASFASGMAAITGVFHTFLRPNDQILYSRPVYGGTDHVLNQMLPPFGIGARSFDAGDSDGLRRAAQEMGDRLRMIYVETPANPTLCMTDIAVAVEAARAAPKPVLVVVDNTFLGPMFQAPLELGVDIVVYSATKYIGGHSDVVAGVALSRERELIDQIKVTRSFFGTICEPFSAWLLQRSLATIYTRTVKQMKNAARIVKRLNEHPKVARIIYPTLFEGEQKRVYESQCSAPGSMVGLDVVGGEAAAFRFLDALKIPKLAVSLGGVETLVTHPRTTTSSEMAQGELDLAGIGEGLVRVSVGVEYWRDLAEDIEQALETA